MAAHVYILTNRRNGTLYIGVTSRLATRLAQHRARAVEGFSATYRLTRCVLVEEYDRLVDARARERQLKQWKRRWKLELIERANPYWCDLSSDICP